MLEFGRGDGLAAEEEPAEGGHPGAGRDVQGRDGNGGRPEGDHGSMARIEPTPGDQAGSETATSVNSRPSRGGRPDDFHGMVLLPCEGQTVMDPPEV
jgi:hypothetical protein